MRFYWRTLDGQKGWIEGFDTGEVKKIKRVSYEERLYVQYANCEITKEELTEKLLNHEQKLEKKRKYKKGEKITSFDELMSQKLVYWNGKVYSYGWFASWQAHFIKNYLDKGWFYKAVKKENNNE